MKETKNHGTSVSVPFSDCCVFVDLGRCFIGWLKFSKKEFISIKVASNTQKYHSYRRMGDSVFGSKPGSVCWDTWSKFAIFISNNYTNAELVVLRSQ
jgi:hypothetical protein